MGTHRHSRVRRRRAGARASLAALVFGASLTLPLLAAAQTAEDPSNVVLVFDVSNSILLSDDGTNLEFAAALEGIAGRVEANAEELALGNAEISFVAFGRGAINYPPGCNRLALHEDIAAVEQLAQCLRSIAGEYEAGADAAVRDRINTQDTDHVAALRRAANLLPATGTRSAVIFFTDGQHDPPGVDRDDEDVVAEIEAAYAGRSPLAILPVGLGAGAGAFEDDLFAIYQAYFRNMEPCEGRASFSWPEVVFQEAEDAGIAVAEALQEVTCSFTFVPTPTATPTAPPTPTPAPTIGPPLSVHALAGNESLTVQWVRPQVEAERIAGWVVRCIGPAGETFTVESAEPELFQVVVPDLTPGVAYTCEVAATDGVTTGPFTAATVPTTVLGIPGAPGRPRAEPMDRAARLTAEAPAGGIGVELYTFQCTNAAGDVFQQAGGEPAVIVGNLVNGDTYTCVAFAENSLGRSGASEASASFTPCADLLDCNPLLRILGLLVAGATALAVGALAFLWYRRRNRAWITAQVDGGENRPLGWGPAIGIRIERDAGGWFAAPRPPDQGGGVTVRYKGANRFDVTTGTRVVDIHQGDPTLVRDADGGAHQLILRRYRDRPNDRRSLAEAPGEAGRAAAAEVGARVEGRRGTPEVPTWADTETPEGMAGATPEATPEAKPDDTSEGRS